MPLPGWNSLETVSKAATFFEVGNIVVLFFLVVGEVFAWKYGHRKEVLSELAAEQKTSDDREKVSDALAASRASLEASLASGTVVLDVRDLYKGHPLTGATCTTNTGRVFPPSYRADLPIGTLTGTCTLAGYHPTPFSGEVRKGDPKSVTVNMEQTTGILVVTSVDDRGNSVSPPVFIDGKTTGAPSGSTQTFRDLPTKLTHVGARETSSTTQTGNSVETVRWGPAEKTVTVRGGIQTHVTLKLRLLEKRRE